MSHKVDAVLSYHLNPLTCGVAKFNHELARRLGVPCGRFTADFLRSVKRPLLSLKASELTAHCWFEPPDHWESFDLLLHDRGQMLFADKAPTRVFYADEVGCPATLNGNASRGKYRVLVFGMSHKLLLPHFKKLKEELDREHPDYTVELSTAVHEGSPWDDALTQSTEAMRAIFGDKLRVLGFLGDDALAKELQDVDAVAMFYQPALRANNTSYWAAVEAGKTIYTNRDELSPKDGDPPASWDRLVELLRA
jgi:hypothetical protein